MARKKPPGLVKRAGIWHVDKHIDGQRVCQSTGTDRLDEAERFLARLTEESRQASVYGVRPSRTFEQAAAKFALENQHEPGLHSDIGRLKLLMPWIGTVTLDRIHTGTLQPRVDHRRKEGAAVGTINHGLEVVRRILNLAANEWVDEHGLTWLSSAPRIKLLSDTNKRKPYPLSREEEGRLFAALPSHLADMALFAANTGCRDGEICSLRWEWAVEVPQVRVHDLKHTFGRRLRSAGVSFEDRQDLLGHRPARITTHYPAVELSRLLKAANSPRLDPLCRLTAVPAEYSSAGTAHRQVL